MEARNEAQRKWSAGTIMRAACEWSKVGGCISPKDEGGRRLPFTAGLARFYASVLGKTRVAIERNATATATK